MIIEHGGNGRLLAQAMGIDSENWIDFSANINPLGISNNLKSVLKDSIDRLTEYPDLNNHQEKKLIKDYHRKNDLNVLLSNGAVGIFYELAKILHPKNLLILSPTFMEYEKAFRQVGSEINYFKLSPSTFTLEVDQLLLSCTELISGDVVLLCNPNNPTGTVITVEELSKIASHLLERDIILIIDEAFVDFMETEDKYSFVQSLSLFQNTIVVRSLTKFYAIPGLRLGYAISAHNSLDLIEEQRAPWTINQLALQAIPAILTDSDYQKKTKIWLGVEKNFLYDSLKMFKELKVLKPTVNYIFFKYEGNKNLQKELWKHKIFIRSCSNYVNLNKEYYRIAIRSRTENEKLLDALKKIFIGGL